MATFRPPSTTSPARDERYILLAAPAFVIGTAIGVAAFAHYLQKVRLVWHVMLLIGSLTLGGFLASRVRVPDISGFREMAAYLQHAAPQDAVLYDGGRDALLGFYLRASDPRFERRMARADKLLYESGPTTTFESWVSTSYVGSTDDVVELLRHRCGCRWVAIETARGFTARGARQLLREAVARREFERVHSFAISSRGERRIDLYRLVEAVEPAKSVDLRFPSFTTREFRGVVPIIR